ncbi:MAG: hypothetical protein ACYDAG_05040 [Chloroflexota bacterium]
MKLTFFQKILLTLLGVGAVGSLLGAGTFAGFSAQTTNNANTISAGTLVMTNAPAGVAPTGCSQTSGNVDCGKVVNVTAAAGLAPGGVATGTVTVTNSGTLPAAYTLTVNGLAGLPGSPTSVCGGGSCSSNGLAGILNVTIHDAFGAGYCLYGNPGAAPAAGACDDITTGPPAAQNPTDAIQSIPTTAITIPGAGTAGKWAVGEVHTFTITVEFPLSPATPNIYQGGTATFNMTWNAS